MIFIRGARQLLTLQGAPIRRGYQLSELSIIPDGGVLIDGETIREVGTTRRLENLRIARDANLIDATGKVVLPGFVDSHTRLVFATPPFQRVDPGQAATSRGGPQRPAPPPPGARPKMSAKALRMQAKRWAERFGVHGATALEVRSGFGLEPGSELKGLQVARSLHDEPLEVAATFSAGLPEGESVLENPDLAAEQIVEVILPNLARRRLARCLDVDCDPDVFGLDWSRRILRAAKQAGWQVRVQADRKRSNGGVKLALEMDALSADHLVFTSDDELDWLAASSTVANLLPAVSYQQGTRFALARQLVDRGAAVALSSGFGPGGGSTVSMPTVLSLACSQMGMRPAEAIAAATTNGAAAMGLSHRLGSLEPGKQADLAIFDVPDYREIPYYFGFNLCVMTIRKGRVICSASGFGQGLARPEPIVWESTPKPEDPLRKLRL